jgi:hypothetical protein
MEKGRESRFTMQHRQPTGKGEVSTSAHLSGYRHELLGLENLEQGVMVCTIIKQSWAKYDLFSHGLGAIRTEVMILGGVLEKLLSLSSLE